MVLIARVRSLTRLKMMTDELRMRALTSRDIGIESPEREAVADTGLQGKILIVDDRPASAERIHGMLQATHTVDVETDPINDIVIVGHSMAGVTVPEVVTFITRRAVATGRSEQRSAMKVNFILGARSPWRRTQPLA